MSKNRHHSELKREKSWKIGIGLMELQPLGKFSANSKSVFKQNDVNKDVSQEGPQDHASVPTVGLLWEILSFFFWGLRVGLEVMNQGLDWQALSLLTSIDSALVPRDWEAAS